MAEKPDAQRIAKTKGKMMNDTSPIRAYCVARIKQIESGYAQNYNALDELKQIVFLIDDLDRQFEAIRQMIFRSREPQEGDMKTLNKTNQTHER